jgi:type IV pilus assembly protein PilC
MYKVRDKSGRVVQGSLEAEDKDVVAQRLRQMGYVPVTIQKKSAGFSTELRMPGSARVKPAELAMITRQFATMVNAGLPILRGLGVLADQAESTYLRNALQAVRTDVERGASLSVAMGRQPKAFSKMYVSMVRAGEASGALDDVMVQLAIMMEKQVALRQKVRSAMTYPIAVFGLVLTIAIAMLVFVVPMFEKLYDNLGGTLPAPTRALLAISAFTQQVFPLMIGATIGLVIAVKRWTNTPSGRLRFDGLKLKMPILGKLVHKAAIARFARTLATLLRSGVPILEAMEITAEVVGNAVIAKVVREARDNVRTGEPIFRPLAQSGVFPAMVVQMMAVGEETGALDELLDKVADFQEGEVESLVSSLTSLLEPILIVSMGITVGSMVVALYLPMFRIITLVSNPQGAGQ